MFEVTELQRRMENAQGHEVEVHLNCESIFKNNCVVGRCIGFTKPIDNEPEVATMDIKVAGYSCIYEIEEGKIKEIIMKD